jgi:hypothetical protein
VPRVFDWKFIKILCLRPTYFVKVDRIQRRRHGRKLTKGALLPGKYDNGNPCKKHKIRIDIA